MRCTERFSHLIHRRFHMLCGNPPMLVAWQERLPVALAQRCLGLGFDSEAPGQWISELRLANSMRSTSEPAFNFNNKRAL